VEDILTLLRRDHEDISALFAELERALGPKDLSVVDVRACFLRLKQSLISHLRAEEEAVYARFRETDDGRMRALAGAAQHAEILAQLEGMSHDAPVDSAWRKRFELLRGEVRTHVESEETELFPLVEATFGRNGRREMGADLVALKLIVEDLLIPETGGFRRAPRGARPDAEIDRHAEE